MFKKFLLLLPLAALLHGGTQAQFRYTFKDTTTVYAPLPASATLLTNGVIWDEEYYSIPMPFSWTLDSTFQLSSFNLALEFPGVASSPLLSGTASTGFTPGVTDFVDRGAIDSTAPKSPIRYLTTGTAPNRIFKVEVANAGFLIERDVYNTLDDSASFQMWIYETSSIVEFHYGPSRISHFNDYFDLFGLPSLITGFVKNLNPMTLSGTFYYLSGPPASVSVQTVSLPSVPNNGLTSWPTNGKVFRFTPKMKPAGIGDLETLGSIKVYPNPASTSLFIEGVSTGTKATLYSMLGQPVLQAVFAGSQTLDIAALPAGVYKLVLTNKAGVSSATTVVKE